MLEKTFTYIWYAVVTVMLMVIPVIGPISLGYIIADFFQQKVKFKEESAFFGLSTFITILLGLVQLMVFNVTN